MGARWKTTDYPVELFESKTYQAWMNMRRRCTPTKGTSATHLKNMRNYVARGITFPEKWKKFSGFLEDMGVAPEGLTLDRLDNDKSYSKENCRWSTHSQQNLNRRCMSNTGHRYISYREERKKYSVRVPPAINWITTDNLKDAIFIRDSLLQGFSL